MAQTNPKNPPPKGGKGKLNIDLKNPDVRNLVIAIGVILLAAYMWFDQVYSPLSESVAELSAKKEKVEAELVRINALKPQLERLRKESEVLNATLDSLKNIFPDSKEVPRLIRELTTVNRRSSITTTKLTPKPDVVQEYYVENKYDVSINGDYHNVGAFFSSLANLQLIVNLTNVSITANPNYKKDSGGPTPDRTPSVLANFELTTFSSRR